MMEETRDQIRRLDAIIGDYDAEADFAEQIVKDDEAKYNEMKKLQKAKVVGYCDYVREKLKEHLGDPTSNNVLSAEICENILTRLEQEQACLEGQALHVGDLTEKETNYTTIIRETA